MWFFCLLCIFCQHIYPVSFSLWFMSTQKEKKNRKRQTKQFTSETAKTNSTPRSNTTGALVCFPLLYSKHIREISRKIKKVPLSFDDPNIYFWESTCVTPLRPCKGSQCFAALLLLQFYLLWYTLRVSPCLVLILIKPNQTHATPIRACFCKHALQREKTQKHLETSVFGDNKSFIYMLQQHTVTRKR